nr:reverse transcriptase domain-containing protein [Tanacetum cinerariifolium]
GYAKAIVVPPILGEQFELKHSLINMMSLDQFFRLEKDNPHDHIRWFNKITSIMKYKDVPNSAIKLMLFPFSLTGAARRWLEKEPPRSILTWEDLVSKFINEFFPPSRKTNLRNKISNFQQRFDESFYEAWDCYKDLLRAYPHYGFTELHQLDTFYNALNPVDQDSLNSAAGGNLLERRTQDVLMIAENKSKCLVADGNTFLEFGDNIQGYVSAAAVNYNQECENELRNKMKTSIQASMSNQTNELKNMLASFFQMNTASTSSLGPLPSNTIANPKVELKAITSQNGLVVDGPSVPMPYPFINLEEDERVEETLTDLNLAEYTIKVPPPLVQKAKPHSQRNYVVPLILGRPFSRTSRALIDLHEEEMILRDSDERLTLNMRHDTLRYSIKPHKESINMINIYDDSYEDYLEDLFATNHLSGNLTFSSQTYLTLPEVINPLSGSTTSSSLDHLLEEFANELALITFYPGNDDLPFDIESNLREIEYLLNHDPTKEMDSILKDLIDEYNLADPNDNLFDTILEMFTDEHTLNYSSPPLYDDVDDNLVELEYDNDDAYNDPFDSKKDKIKESKLLIDELDPSRSSDFLPSPEYDSFLFEDFSKVDACLQPITRI